MTKFIAFLLLCSVAFANPPAKLPSGLEKREPYIAQMQLGERVWVYSGAMVVDGNGGCWLKPNWIAFNTRKPVALQTELEVIRTNLGYVVRVEPGFTKVRGYKVTTYPKWERMGIVTGCIPVLSVIMEKPLYDRPGPEEKIREILESQRHSQRSSRPKGYGY